jgi:hypothetical protein
MLTRTVIQSTQRSTAMRRYIGLLAAMTLTLGLIAASASGGRLSITSRFFRTTWHSLELKDASSGSPVIKCPVTLEGSFHSATFKKVRWIHFGYVTRGIVNTVSVCTGGTATILQEALPWTVLYESFSGTLPNITAMELAVKDIAFRYQNGTFGFTCLYHDRGAPEENEGFIMERDEATGALTAITINILHSMPKSEGSASCPSRARFGPNIAEFEGTGQVTQLTSTTRITLTLI